MSTQKIKEANLWRWLSKAKLDVGPQLKLDRIENGIDSGTPDVYGCFVGDSFWIELKALAVPTNMWRISLGLSPDQISWHYNHSRAGGVGWVLVQFGSGKDTLRILMPSKEVIGCQNPISIGTLMSSSVNATQFSPIEVISHAARAR